LLKRESRKKTRRIRNKMEEKKFVQLKKDELNVKEFIKNNLGKGKISGVGIEYAPIGEKIIISTNKPGFVIGRKGEKIAELTKYLKKQFKLENPHIEIQEISKPEFDAQTVADEIALLLERFGNIKFKIVAYKMLDKIMKAGALGAEIRLGGKLPSERAKSWRFASGYLKKTGDTAKIVDRAQATAKTMSGVIGVKVSILPPGRKIHDQIEINDELRRLVKTPRVEEIVEKKKKSKKTEK
jgi:small subunit ribosomal protein S3